MIERWNHIAIDVRKTKTETMFDMFRIAHT